MLDCSVFRMFIRFLCILSVKVRYFKAYNVWLLYLYASLYKKLGKYRTSSVVSRGGVASFYVNLRKLSLHLHRVLLYYVILRKYYLHLFCLRV